MSQHHGHPEIDGAAVPYAAIQGPMSDAWADESTYVTGRNGRRRRKGKRRLRPRYRMTFAGTAAQWLDFRTRLQGDANGEFGFKPRTIDFDYEDEGDEFETTCRCVSDLTTLTPIWMDDVYVVDVEVEGVETYEDLPG